MKELNDKNRLSLRNEQGTDSKLVPFSLTKKLSVNLKYHPLKVLLQKAYRAYLVRADLNLKSNMKISTRITKKHPAVIPHQINNSQGWYQNVLKPRYKKEQKQRLV